MFLKRLVIVRWWYISSAWLSLALLFTTLCQTYLCVICYHPQNKGLSHPSLKCFHWDQNLLTGAMTLMTLNRFVLVQNWCSVSLHIWSVVLLVILMNNPPKLIYTVLSQGPVVDLSARGLQKLESSFTCSEDTHTLILDRNHIMKLDHLERSPSLQQVEPTLRYTSLSLLFLYKHKYNKILTSASVYTSVLSSSHLSSALSCKQPFGENDGSVSADGATSPQSSQ